MSRRIIAVGALILPGCAMEGGMYLAPCTPCKMGPPAVVRSCGEPIHAAPPPPVIHSTPQNVEQPGDLMPAPTEAVPPVTPTTRWRPVKVD